ncbi:MAG: hypothetical protein QM504_03355 [Pseudomonadota bacterium]
MKIILLLILVSSATHSQFLINEPIKDKGIVITQNAADILLKHKLNPAESLRYEELKKELLNVINLAIKLDKKQMEELLKSSYVKNIRRELKTLSVKLKEI